MSHFGGGGQRVLDCSARRERTLVVASGVRLNAEANGKLLFRISFTPDLGNRFPHEERRSLVRPPAGPVSRTGGAPQTAGAMNLTYTDTVANYCEMISKEDQGRRMWKKRFGHLYGADGASSGWRPVEPFEKGSSSYSDTELPPKIPSAAVSYPFLFTDSVGDLGLAGGTPKRFGGKWDCTQRQPTTDSKPPRVVKKGPHDCYCEIGFGAWSMAGKARTVNHGLKEAGLKDLWTNTPGCAHALCRSSTVLPATSRPNPADSCPVPLLSPVLPASPRVLTWPPSRTAQRAGACLGLQGEQGQEAQGGAAEAGQARGAAGHA